MRRALLILTTTLIAVLRCGAGAVQGYYDRGPPLYEPTAEQEDLRPGPPSGQTVLYRILQAAELKRRQQAPGEAPGEAQASPGCSASAPASGPASGRREGVASLTESGSETTAEPPPRGAAQPVSEEAKGVSPSTARIDGKIAESPPQALPSRHDEPVLPQFRLRLSSLCPAGIMLVLLAVLYLTVPWRQGSRILGGPGKAKAASSTTSSSFECELLALLRHAAGAKHRAVGGATRGNRGGKEPIRAAAPGATSRHRRGSAPTSATAGSKLILAASAGEDPAAAGTGRRGNATAAGSKTTRATGDDLKACPVCAARLETSASGPTPSSPGAGADDPNGSFSKSRALTLRVQRLKGIECVASSNRRRPQLPISRHVHCERLPDPFPATASAGATAGRCRALVSALSISVVPSGPAHRAVAVQTRTHWHNSIPVGIQTEVLLGGGEFAPSGDSEAGSLRSTSAGGGEGGGAGRTTRQGGKGGSGPASSGRGPEHRKTTPHGAKQTHAPGAVSGRRLPAGAGAAVTFAANTAALGSPPVDARTGSAHRADNVVGNLAVTTGPRLTVPSFSSTEVAGPPGTAPEDIPVLGEFLNGYFGGSSAISTPPPLPLERARRSSGGGGGGGMHRSISGGTDEDESVRATESTVLAALKTLYGGSCDESGFGFGASASYLSDGPDDQLAAAAAWALESPPPGFSVPTRRPLIKHPFSPSPPPTRSSEGAPPAELLHPELRPRG